jgi:hypothetical protein
MGEINLSYLNENEIISLYELFFGNVLIKKNGFSYYDNLSKNLTKEEVITNSLQKLNDIEKSILKILSFTTIIPYKFINEKLSILLDLPIISINKAINNLLEKKFIFIRNDNSIVIPNIFYKNEKQNIYFQKINPLIIDKKNNLLTDFNNLINIFISKEIKFTNNFNLYKKDIETVKEYMSNYSNFDDTKIALVGNFFCRYFFDNENNLLYNCLQSYFEMENEKKLYCIIENTLPSFYNLLMNFDEGYSIKIDIENFKKLYNSSFLITEYKNEPIDVNFENLLFLLNEFELIEYNTSQNYIIFPVKSNNKNIINDQVNLTTSFNVYINADTRNPNYYLLSFFADIIKYNKISEYEITENSIKRCSRYNITIENIRDFFKAYKIELPKNVETTIQQWFDKYGSYYYTSGTIFFCQTTEKGKIISSLIDKGFIHAYQIKKDEIFLIPEDSKKEFFEFLGKTGIYYNFKNPVKLMHKSKITPTSLKQILNFIENN